MNMDKETKIILSMAAFAVLAFLSVAAWAFMRFDSRNDLCQERGGIMLKSPNGWVCVDAKVLK